MSKREFLDYIESIIIDTAYDNEDFVCSQCIKVMNDLLELIYTYDENRYKKIRARVYEITGIDGFRAFDPSDLLP